MTTKRELVTLGEQIEGLEAAEIVAPVTQELKNALREATSKQYSLEIQELALVLRIDGSITQWNKTGCDRLRLQRKQGYATVDIYVPLSAWKDALEFEFRQYLAKHVREGIRMMLDRINSKKIEFDSVALVDDVEQVLKHFVTKAVH